MKFSIKGTNIELTDGIRNAVAKKLATLDERVKKLGGSVTGDVEVAKTSNHHKKGAHFRAEIQVHLPGAMLYAESIQEDLYVAINDAKNEVGRQIRKYKGKKEAKTVKKAARTKRA